MNEICSYSGGEWPPETKRVRCPKCGRRMIARTVVIDEYPNRKDSVIIKRVPPHKVKGWYKKPKPKKKERHFIR